MTPEEALKEIREECWAFLESDANPNKGVLNRILRAADSGLGKKKSSRPLDFAPCRVCGDEITINGRPCGRCERSMEYDRLERESNR